MRDLLQIERLMLPSPAPLFIQNICDLAIAVAIQQRVDLRDNLRLRLSNLRDWQWLDDGETSGGAAPEAHMDLDQFSVD
jgi:hypothetical protein